MKKTPCMLLVWLVLACQEKQPSKVPLPNFPVGQSTIFVPNQREKPNQEIAEVPVEIYRPKKKLQGNILVFPGWNFPRQDWLQKTNLKQWAQKTGLLLVLPEMKQAIYATQYFPETKRKAFPMPSGKWVTDVLLPFMQLYRKTFLPEQNNFLLGLSTGARGVALIALNTGKLFKAGAGFSGDYEQTQMPRDKLITAVYGPYTLFPQRWQTVDNPVFSAAKLQVPLYLSHGWQDKVVPAQQTQLFCQALRQKNPRLKVKCFLDKTAGHTYTFWEKQLKPAFQFFTSLWEPVPP